MVCYKDEIDFFKWQVKEDQEVFMPRKEDEFTICKQLVRMRFNKIEHLYIDSKNFKKMFLRSIDLLGAKTKEYYKDATSKLEIDRTPKLVNGDSIIVGNSKDQTAYITNRKSREDDFIAFSHEMGHYKVIVDSSHGDYFEYGEVLPMFLEYLSCKTINEKNAYEMFLRNRLQAVKSDAQEYFKLRNTLKGNNSAKDEYIRLEMKNRMRYFISVDYVLQLIERFKKDRSEVSRAIDEYLIDHNTFKNLESRLDIDTTGCKTLLRRANYYVGGPRL